MGGTFSVSGFSWILRFSLSLPCLMRGMFSPFLRVRSISFVALELHGKGADRTRLIATPSQILECRPRRFVEALRIPPMDYSLQDFGYIGEVFRQLPRIFVVDQLVLVGSSMRTYRWTQNWALTRARATVALTVLKTCFPEEASTVPLFNI